MSLCSNCPVYIMYYHSTALQRNILNVDDSFYHSLGANVDMQYMRFPVSKLEYVVGTHRFDV